MSSKNLQLISDYRNNESHRRLFFDFINEVFPGCDFLEWQKRGFWTESYIPFSILEDGKIISNASIQMMDLIVDGKRKKGLQFSAVGTINSFRMRGLSRLLMEKILHATIRVRMCTYRT